MNNSQIRFEDGAAYERYMGKWSQLAGKTFLDWLAPGSGLRWLDVGCGNGAFTELLADRCAPAEIHGVDPAEGQLRFARTRPVSRLAQFSPGDAMALPFEENRFDIAVMPLVIFFVPEPSQGVAEMVRVVRPGGIVCAYAWDMLGNGFPYEALRSEMQAMGVDVPTPPSPGASQLEALLNLWSNAGLRGVETTEIAVQRTYADFEDYWATVLGAPSAGSRLAVMTAEDIRTLRERLRERLPTNPAGQITCAARAYAIKGTV